MELFSIRIQRTFQLVSTVIENIIQVMGDGKCTVDDYVKNVLQSKLCEINDVQCIASKA